jgi:hypothetical protein
VRFGEVEPIFFGKKRDSVVFRRRKTMANLATFRVWWLLPLAAAAACAGGWAGAAPSPDGFRRLAPGTLTVIPPDRSSDDPLQRSDLLEITEGRKDREWTPQRSPVNTTFIERAKGRELAGGVWCLEFAFKPPRLIDVDVPAGDAKMRRKRVWYVLYRVKNTGGRRVVVDAADPTVRQTETFEQPVRFLPHFVLESLEPLAQGEDMRAYRAYLDRVVPSAMEPIRAREKPPGRLYDSASMAEAEIAPGEDRWGVAVWEDVDPRIDFFSIFVRGLTNSMRWRKIPGARIGAGDPPGAHMEYALEALRLDFWRPGDARDEVEEEMSVGYAGMLERMTLGSRILEAAGRPLATKSRPVSGLEALGLKWSDLLEPDAGGGMASLLPLETVLRKLAALGDPLARGAAVRDVFGELGIQAIEDLTRALAGPVDADRDATRRAALEKLGLTPEQVAAKPLESLAKVVRALESAPTYDDRARAAAACFGSAERRVEQLARDLASARALAALEDVEGGADEVTRGDSLAAFAAVQRLLESDPQQGRKQEVLRGLFGPRGPELYAAAAAVHEGIDHAWVFRYERDAPGP